MKIRHLVILLLAASAALSFVYSKDVYDFYLKTYYTRVKKLRPDRILSRGEALYKEKKYRELNHLMKTALLVFPENTNIKLLAGLSLLESGDRERGARLVLQGIDRDRTDTVYLCRALRVLFDAGLYGDIIQELGRHAVDDDMELSYMLGVSLYKRGRFESGVKALLDSERLGNHSAELYQALGLAYEGLHRPKEAIRYLLEAWSLDPSNRESRDALIRLYTKTGDLARAEKLARMSVR